jgi:hypothetical protein
MARDVNFSGYKVWGDAPEDSKLAQCPVDGEDVYVGLCKMRKYSCKQYKERGMPMYHAKCDTCTGHIEPVVDTMQFCRDCKKALVGQDMRCIRCPQCAELAEKVSRKRNKVKQQNKRKEERRLARLELKGV